MKQILNIISFLTLAILLTSCGKDNYDEPTSTLSGQIMYQGTPLQLRGSGGAITLQLYQDGFKYKGAYNVFVNQDGTFKAKLVDGTYKMVTKDKNGPWVNKRDTSWITVKGNTVYNLDDTTKILPYFVVSNESITIADSANVSFKCNIALVAPKASLKSVTVIIGGTYFSDDFKNIVKVAVTGATVGALDYNLLLNDIYGHNTADNKKKSDDMWAKIKASKFLYARVAVQDKLADQAVYTKVVKLR